MACDLRCDTAKGGHKTPEQVDLVQRSWRSVLPVGDPAAELFYGKLFSLDPTVKRLSRTGSLSRPERILLAVQQLGRRHAVYGVEARHYELVRGALLWMLDQILGEAFTPEVGAAWCEVYSLFATTMQEPV